MGTIFLGLVTLIGALLTRRSAKDTNAVDGYDRLTGRLETRLAVVEGQVVQLQERERERDERDEKHSQWDRQVYGQARDAGWDVSPPPPLG